MAVFTHLDNIHAVSEFCLELASHGCLQHLVSLQCTSLQVNSLSPSFLSSIRAFSLSACSTMIQQPLLPPTILPYYCSSLSFLCPYNPVIISHYLTTLSLLISLECVNERYNKVWIGLKIHQRNAKVGGVRFGVYWKFYNTSGKRYHMTCMWQSLSVYRPVDAKTVGIVQKLFHSLWSHLSSHSSSHDLVIVFAQSIELLVATLPTDTLLSELPLDRVEDIIRLTLPQSLSQSMTFLSLVLSLSLTHTLSLSLSLSRLFPAQLCVLRAVLLYLSAVQTTSQPLLTSDHLVSLLGILQQNMTSPSHHVSTLYSRK